MFLEKGYRRFLGWAELVTCSGFVYGKLLEIVIFPAWLQFVVARNFELIVLDVTG